MLKLTSRKRLSFFLSYILIVSQPLPTFGAVLKPIDVEWDFSGSATSFRLYQDGIFLCDTYDTSSNRMICEALIDDQPISFTMTAVTAEGETPPSTEYIVTPPAQDGYGNYIPTAVLTADVTSGDVPLTISFDASASSDFDGTIVSYEWDYGDGDVGNSEFTNHTFLLPGIYTTTLTVIDDASASSSTTITIEVTDPQAQALPDNILPTAVINAVASADSTMYQFDAYDSTDEDGLIVDYHWNFGDGETGTSNFVEHNYAVAGTYTVTLTVTDDQDGTNETQQIITVADTSSAGELPIARITTGLTKHRIQASWEYNDTTNLSGFRLYQNGSPICETMEPTATQIECQTYLENGPMSFALRAVDTSGAESLFSEAMTYTPSSPAITTEGDAPLSVFLNGGNSSDADGPIASYLWDFGDGSIATTSAAEHIFSIAGDYTVRLTVKDSDGNESTTSTVVTVLGNLPPIASDSTLNTTEDTAAQGTLSASDADGDPLTYAISLNGSKGTATVTNSSTGAFIYTPTANANGTDSINFYASDDSGLLSNVGVVTVNISAVNDSPVAQNISLTTTENTTVNSIISASDPDGDALTYSITSNGSLGNASITGTNTGAFTYTPHTGVSGNDTFTISASDGSLSATATVSVTISAVNDAPVAVNDNASTTSNTAVTINVLANDSDQEGDTMTITAVSTPANGTAAISGSTVLYTPTSNFSGEDSFTYTVSDSHGEASQGTVTVTVTPEATTQSLLTMLITFNWDYDDTAAISGFNIYQNHTKICATSDPTARQLTCEIPLIESPASFTLTSVDLNGIESDPSNLMNFDPTSMLTNYTLVTLTWDYNNEADISGFRVYLNSTPICETYDHQARSISCLIQETSNTMDFTLTALNTDNTESNMANSIKYSPEPLTENPNDKDGDGDVDGADLVNVTTTTDIDALAASFGAN